MNKTITISECTSGGAAARAEGVMLHSVMRIGRNAYCSTVK